ncbi:MAG: hypothetical protein PHW96_03765 [Candidatus Nanoarchaeia archaeon]|nr:hypothetical protein [Candidatus Nanoarchaeia archaeon]
MAKKKKNLEVLVGKVFKHPEVICNLNRQVAKYYKFWTDVYAYTKNEAKNQIEGYEDLEAVMENLSPEMMAEFEAFGLSIEETKEKISNSVKETGMNKIEELCDKLNIKTEDIYQRMSRLEESKDYSFDELISIGEGIEKRFIDKVDEEGLTAEYLRHCFENNNNLTAHLINLKQPSYRNIRASGLSRQTGIKDISKIRYTLYEFLYEKNKKSKNLEHKENGVNNFVELPYGFEKAYIPLKEFIKGKTEFNIKELKKTIDIDPHHLYFAIDVAVKLGRIERTKRGAYSVIKKEIDEEKKQNLLELSDLITDLRNNFFRMSADFLRNEDENYNFKDDVKESLKEYSENENDMVYFTKKIQTQLLTYIEFHKPGTFPELHKRMILNEKTLRRTGKLLAEYYTGTKSEIISDFQKIFGWSNYGEDKSKKGTYIKKITEL